MGDLGFGFLLSKSLTDVAHSSRPTPLSPNTRSSLLENIQYHTVEKRALKPDVMGHAFSLSS